MGGEISGVLNRRCFWKLEEKGKREEAVSENAQDWKQSMGKVSSKKKNGQPVLRLPAFFL